MMALMRVRTVCRWYDVVVQCRQRFWRGFFIQLLQRHRCGRGFHGANTFITRVSSEPACSSATKVFLKLGLAGLLAIFSPTLLLLLDARLLTPARSRLLIRLNGGALGTAETA